MKALFWFVTILILACSSICLVIGFGDEKVNFSFLAFTGALPLFLAFIFHQLKSSDRLLCYVVSCSFISVSLFAIYFLGVLALHAIGSGSIGPSGMILIIFPFAYIGLGIGGAILGLLMYLTERLIKKYA